MDDIKREKIHGQINYMINWLETNENRYKKSERLRKYAGIEILLYILGWFPNGKLPVQEIEKEHKFLFWEWTTTRRERYDELMERLIETWKINHE